MKAVVFTARSDYARFRKPYTTTSGLTYLCIHPVAVRGLIGAVLGIDRSELFEKTKDLKIAVEVLTPPDKDLQSFNLMNMKSSNLFRFPSNIEFLRNVHYRISVMGDGALLESLKKVLLEKAYGFTPYLGISEHIAVLNFEGMHEVEGPMDGENPVCSVVDIASGMPEWGGDMQIYTDRIPVKNNEGRQYTEYRKVVFTPGKKLKGSFKNIYRVGDRYVHFL